jgi:hypothetical protein
MAMSDEHRKAVQDANRRRGNCPNCGTHLFGRVIKDGSEVGGLPGIKYKVCDSCGHARAITHRPRKFKF